MQERDIFMRLKTGQRFDKKICTTLTMVQEFFDSIHILGHHNRTVVDIVNRDNDVFLDEYTSILICGDDYLSYNLDKPDG